MIVPFLLAAALAAQDTTHLTLADAVRRALAAHPSVAAASANRDAAAASVGEARAPLFPRVSASFGATQYKIGNLVYPLSGLSLANPPLFNSTLSQGALSLGYTLFDFGGRTSQVRLAQAQERKAEAALDAASAGRSPAWPTPTSASSRLAGSLRPRSSSSPPSRPRPAESPSSRPAGKAAHVEVLRLAAQASRAGADAVATRAQLDVAERDLAQLVALPVETARPQLVAVHLADTALADRATLVASAERNSPEVDQARRAAEAAAAGVGVARASLLPQLQLNAAYVEYGHQFTGYRPFWNAGLQLSYPIFTGGSRSGAIRRNQASARAANEQLRAAEQASELSVDGALATLTAAHATVEALVTAVAQSEEVERIRLLSVQVGSGTETDYLEAEATLLSNRAGLVQARHAEIAARIELARVTGQLSPDWLSRVVQQ